MKLTTKQIIALQTIKGVSTKSILLLGQYVKDNDIPFDSLKELVLYLKSLKINRFISSEDRHRIEISVEDLIEAENKAQKIIDANQAMGIGAFSYYDDIYPSILRKTIGEDGKINPPMVLFYKGELSCLNMPCLAVIGTREVTPEGEKAGLFLSGAFAKRGFCIVSGLAIGCDTCGHRGALNVGGKTIAFLAHGLNSVYPPENKDLAEEIIEKGGLLLSEYSLEESVSAYRLVARDRLQAGLSLATLVIQTGVVGGTMHAANTTLIANKPLYTVRFKDPETQNHEKSQGNALLVNKGAKYIKGDDNFDSISEFIKNYHKPQELLFNFD